MFFFAFFRFWLFRVYGGEKPTLDKHRDDKTSNLLRISQTSQ